MIACEAVIAVNLSAAQFSAPDLKGMTEPVLVASADGVGTKLEVAALAGVHDTVGRDLVNHCVNDILVQGARPLFFLDYVATGRLDPAVLAAVVSGIARGCRENGCALLGGETAEMPGFYGDGRYDVAGFIVGIVDRPKVLDGSRVRVGDHLVGLPSAGLHTNGYSLARKLVFEVAGLRVHDRMPALPGTVGEALLAEHRSYLPVLRGALDATKTQRFLKLKDIHEYFVHKEALNQKLEGVRNAAFGVMLEMQQPRGQRSNTTDAHD